MKNIVNFISVCLLGFCLSACFGPVKVSEKSTYLIDKIPAKVVTRHQRPLVLLVMNPETRPAYNTTQMAYTIKPYQISYFSQNQWAETPSQMLAPLLRQTLQKTHLFKAVVSPPYLGNYHYILNTDIEELQQNFICCPARLELTVNVELSRASNNQIIASKQFTVSQPLRSKTPYAGVIAANNATALLLKKIAAFCVTHIR